MAGCLLFGYAVESHVGGEAMGRCVDGVARGGVGGRGDRGPRVGEVRSIGHGIRYVVEVHTAELALLVVDGHSHFRAVWVC